MSNTPHTLGNEFPGQMDEIHALKASNTRFAKILLEYDAVNDELHRSETNITPVSQDHETALRKQRLVLKDQIAQELRENTQLP